MHAAVIYGSGDLRVGEVEVRTIEPDEVLIRIHACGICPSDLRFYEGARKDPPRPLPYVPGHEWAGVVEQVGEAVQGFKPGDRVVPNPRVICGHCYYCGKGMSNYCTNLVRRVTGGFAEYGVAPASNLYHIADHVSFEEASFCEPLACCINGNQNSSIQLGDDVVVVGTGAIGLMHVQLAKAAGARVIAVERIVARLELAARLGADELIDGTREDPVARVKELTGGRGANAIIVAVGGAAPAELALQLGDIGASINLFAGTHPTASIPLDLNLIHYKQLRLTGSHDFTPHHFRTALKYISEGRVAVKPLISHYLPLNELKRGFEIVGAREGIKVMVQTVSDRRQATS